jgi:hypothetical protein
MDLYQYYSLPSFRWLHIRFLCKNIKNFDKNILINLLKKFCKIKRILLHVNNKNDNDNNEQIICLLEIENWSNLFNDEVSEFIYKLENNKNVYLIDNNIVFIIKKENKTPLFETIELNDNLIKTKENYNKLKFKYIQLLNKYNNLNEKYTLLNDNNEMNKSMLNGIITFLEYGFST